MICPFCKNDTLKALWDKKTSRQRYGYREHIHDSYFECSHCDETMNKQIITTDLRKITRNMALRAQKADNLKHN